MIKKMHYIVFLGLMIFSMSLFGQQENKIIREGNRLFNNENFDGAEIKYREALELNPSNASALYNLGNALYKQGRFDEAAEIFDAISQTAQSPDIRSKALHNLGNSHMGLQDYAKSIDAYKESLRINPDDLDSRYNLVYALNQLQEQEQQQQQDQNDSESDDQDDQQDEQQQQPDDGDDDQDQEQDQQQEQQERPDEISPQDAERILDALRQEEQKVIDEMEEKKKKAVPGRVDREW